MSNKKPQNDEVFTSKFDIPCSIFCGTKEFYSSQILTFPLCQVCAETSASGEEKSYQTCRYSENQDKPQPHFIGTHSSIISAF